MVPLSVPPADARGTLLVPDLRLPDLLRFAPVVLVCAPVNVLKICKRKKRGHQIKRDFALRLVPKPQLE